MDALREERDRIAREHGPWQDRIPLAPGLYTAERTDIAAKAGSILQAVGDAVGDLAHASVIDLGAAEGLFSVEFATHGSQVVAVEGRVGNVEKARFAQRALGLQNLEIVHGDVRDLDTSRSFDVVLCLGVLYHLEGSAAVKLCHDMAAITGQVTVIDTQTARRGTRPLAVGGRTYMGKPIREFDPAATTSEQERLSRSALGNPEAFWLTRPSLFNLLSDAGFTTVMELRVPHVATWNDRVTLLCFKKPPLSLATIEGAKTVPWVEREDHGPHPAGTWQGELRRRFAPYIPSAAKEALRRRRAGL